MHKLNVLPIALLCSVALSGCPTQVPPTSRALPEPIVLAPAPADVMIERPANFRTRLLNFFSSSSPTPTTSPDSSLPRKP